MKSFRGTILLFWGVSALQVLTPHAAGASAQLEPLSASGGSTRLQAQAASGSGEALIAVRDLVTCLKRFCFDPAEMTIAVNTDVVWSNQSIASHDITSCPSSGCSWGTGKGTFSGGELAAPVPLPVEASLDGIRLIRTGQPQATDSSEETVSIATLRTSFKTPGIYDYYCAKHENEVPMHGTIRVLAEGEVPPPGSVASSPSPPLPPGTKAALDPIDELLAGPAAAVSSQPKAASPSKGASPGRPRADVQVATAPVSPAYIELAKGEVRAGGGFGHDRASGPPGNAPLRDSPVAAILTAASLGTALLGAAAYFVVRRLQGRSMLLSGG